MIRRSLLAVVFSALLLGAGVLGAAAHDTLLESNPTDGAELDRSPEQIALTFDAHILDVSPALVLNGPGGEVEVSEPEVVGPELITALPSLKDGNYTVNWRVVSSDGHPISGTFAFAVGDAPAADAADGEPEAAAEPAAESGGSIGLIVAIAAVIALAAAIVLLVARRPKRNA